MDGMNSKKLKLCIFGASQGVGKHILTQALALGYKTTVLLRDPSKVSEFANNPNLSIIQGDVLDCEKVKEITKEQNVIINSLGGWDDVCSKGTKIIIDAMKENKIRRIITCSSLGVGDSYNNCSFITKGFIWGFISKPIADKNIQEQYLNESGLDSVIVRPGGLTDSAPTGKYLTENVSGGRIPRADVAAFILEQVNSDKYLGKAVSIVSP